MAKGIADGELTIRPLTAAHVDDLNGLAGGHHLFHFLHADALDVAELRLFEEPGSRNFGCVFISQLQRRPIHVAQVCIDVGPGVGAEVHVVGVLVHVERQDWHPASDGL